MILSIEFEATEEQVRTMGALVANASQPVAASATNTEKEL